MRPRILDHLLVLRQEVVHECPRLVVANDAVVLGQQQEHWRVDVFRCETQAAVEPGARSPAVLPLYPAC